MNRPVKSLALALALSAIAAAPAAAAPSKAGAESALEKKVERSYRNQMGNGEFVITDCRKKKTTRSEVRYRCDWAIAGQGRYDDWEQGHAWVYGNRRGRASYAVILTA